MPTPTDNIGKDDNVKSKDDAKSQDLLSDNEFMSRANIAIPNMWISAKTMFFYLTWLRITDVLLPPSDNSDFWRCLDAVSILPEIKNVFPKIRLVSDKWKWIIDNWDKMEKLYTEQVDWKRDWKELYEFMKSLWC